MDQISVFKTISGQRLSRYRQATGGDVEKSIDFYIWNLKTSAAFLPALGLAEIALRNAFDCELRTRFGYNWFESVSFLNQLPEFWRLKLIQMTSEQRKKRQRNLLPDDIVAELNFGFWVHLSTPKVERSVWARSFPRIFPNAPVEQPTSLLNAKMERMRLLRNRIAHHEPIFMRPLAIEYENIRDLIRWRCASTCELLDAISILHHELAACPIQVAQLPNFQKALP